MNRTRLPAVIRAKREKGRRLALRVKANADRAVIDIYGDIGPSDNDHVLAGDILKGLRDVTADTIELRINSQGGDSFDGIAVYNDLRSNSARKEVVITGIAASAASIIAMAGDRVAIADGAQILIHNAWTQIAGDANMLEKVAAELRSNSAAMARIYAARTGIPEDEIRALMDNEVLLTAQEAVDLGFADEIVGVDGRPVKRVAKQRRRPQAKKRNPVFSERMEAARELRELNLMARHLRRLKDGRKAA